MSSIQQAIEELQCKIQSLTARLEKGSAMIEAARELGMQEQLLEYETFWIGLLREYELACDKLQVLVGVDSHAENGVGNERATSSPNVDSN